MEKFIRYKLNEDYFKDDEFEVKRVEAGSVKETKIISLKDFCEFVFQNKWSHDFQGKFQEVEEGEDCLYVKDNQTYSIDICPSSHHLCEILRMIKSGSNPYIDNFYLIDEGVFLDTTELMTFIAAEGTRIITTFDIKEDYNEDVSPMFKIDKDLPNGFKDYEGLRVTAETRVIYKKAYKDDELLAEIAEMKLESNVFNKFASEKIPSESILTPISFKVFREISIIKWVLLIYAIVSIVHIFFH